MTQPASSRSSQARQSLTGFRLRRHADYQTAYKAARKHQSSSMSWFLAPRTGDEVSIPRVGLTVGKVIGPAHERNRIKRRMRDCLRKHTALLPSGFDLILHPRRSVLTIEYAKLESEIVRILTQAQKETQVQKEAASMSATEQSTLNSGSAKLRDARSRQS